MEYTALDERSRIGASLKNETSPPPFRVGDIAHDTAPSADRRGILALGLHSGADGIEDAKPQAPVVHWTTCGSVGYSGPHAPVGDPPHHYHIQVFALDAALDAPGGSDRDTLLSKIKGHVIAKGELVGLYSQTANPAPQRQLVI